MLKSLFHNRIINEIARCRQRQCSTTRRLLHQHQHCPTLSCHGGSLPFGTRQQRLLVLSKKQRETAKSIRWHGDSNIPHDAPTVNLTFLQPDGTTHITVPARIGESLLQTAHRHEIDLEGACEGVCACSTCHLIIPQSVYDTLPEASENEEDMLDMAFGLTETSRLGCQVKVTSEMDGIIFEMPKATRNFYVDGHKPKPH